MPASDETPRASRLDVGAILAAAEAAAPVGAVDAVARALEDAFGAERVSFLIADFSGDALIRLGHSADGWATRRTGDETGDRVPLTGSPQGRALAGQSVEVVDTDDGCCLYAPVTTRGEAVGVLELRLARRPGPQTLDDVAQAGHVLAYVVIANRRHTDLFEWGQRSVPLSLAAEIQHRLLPGSYTCEAPQFTLAAWLEPAGEVGGDTFDFSLDRDALHLSISDAMGHTVEAALLATLMIGSIRNGRRRGADLPDLARLADAALEDHAGSSTFVTGQLARVDLASGVLQVVNAGHPPPLRLRGGAVDVVPLHADPPFGTHHGAGGYALQEVALRPGDRLLFVTDGVQERGAAEAQIRTVLRQGGGEHPRQAVQQVIKAAVQAAGGKLEDDATVLCLDWHGGPARDRQAAAGAAPVA